MRSRDGHELPDVLRPKGLDRIYRRPVVARAVARAFNKVAYYRMDQTLFGSHWLGTTIVKYPTDVWVYQELIFEQRPDVILETGTYMGGGTLFLASVCELLGHGRVVSVDTARFGDLPEHERISYLLGSSTDPQVAARVRNEIGEATNVLVILDSDHTQGHVLAELRTYAGLVPLGGSLVVEDSCVNGNPVLPDFGPGPMEAIDAFLAERPEFSVDRSRERFMLTQNPRGFLRREG